MTFKKITKLFILAVIILMPHAVYAEKLNWKPGEFKEMILLDRPTVTMDEQPADKVILKFKTRMATPGAKVSVRALPRDRDVRFTMAFDSFREKDDNKTSTEHKIAIKTNHVKRAMAGGEFPADGADISYTLEIYAPDNNSAFLYEGVFRLIADGEKYRLAPCIIDGPFITKVKADSAELFFRTDEPVTPTVTTSGNGKTIGSEGREHIVKLEGFSPDTVNSYSIYIDNRRYFSSRFRTAPLINTGNRFNFAYMGDSRIGNGSGHEDFCGTNRKALEAALIEAKRQDARFIIYGGDLISGYTSSRLSMEIQYEQFKRVLTMTGHMIPLYPCMGNHEIVGDTYVTQKDGRNYNLVINRDGIESSEAIFASQFNNFDESYPAAETKNGKKGPSYKETVYSFDYGNCHVAVLNTEYWYRLIRPAETSMINAILEEHGGNRNGYIMEQQMKWLDQDLRDAKNKGIKHLFVMMHEPVFPNSSHTQDSMFWGSKKDGKWTGMNDKKLYQGDIGDMRERFLDVLSRNKVKAIFCAHEHGYNRLKIDTELAKTALNPIWQITSAGVGAPYATQNPTMPWANKIINYCEDHNIVVIKVNDDKVGFESISSTGEILDRDDSL